MYNETYDDYIRSILGYPVRNQFDQFNQGQQEYQGYQEYRNPTFNSNINKDWYKTGANLYNSSLAKTLINPRRIKRIDSNINKNNVRIKHRFNKQ